MMQYAILQLFDIIPTYLNRVFSRLSLDVICSAAFSAKVDSQDDTKEEQEIVKHAKALLEGVSLKKTFVLLCCEFVKIAS